MSESVDAAPAARRRLRLPAPLERVLSGMGRKAPVTPGRSPTDDQAPQAANPAAPDDAGPGPAAPLFRIMRRIRASRRPNRRDDAASGSAQDAREPRRRRHVRVVLASIACLLGVAWIGTQTPLVTTIESFVGLGEAEQAGRTSAGPPQPAGGVMSSVPGARLAPLTLQSGEKNHYVKLTDQDGRDVLTVFVPAGQRIDVKAPLGTFTMSWASGQTWHDEHRFFGPQTRFQRSKEPFEFIQTDSDYMGYDVDLSQREAGNLPIDRIDRTTF